MIIDTVRLFLEKYDLLRPKNNIIVAFSGGYDSMCLLDILKKLSKKYDFNLIAVHLNHNWRGEESDNEELNCKNFCRDIQFYSERLSIDIPHTETIAREERYKFFERCAKKFNSSAILTAHNANDNAETVFYRILKGTGIYGLEGISENRGIYYRPLLNVYRDEIENYCKINNLSPNSDSSNFDTKYFRNKIRHKIFPQLKQQDKNIEKHLNQLSKSAKIANEIIQTQIKNLEKYSTEEFCNLSEEFQHIIIHKFFRDNNLDYDKKRINNLCDFINATSKSKSGKTRSLTTNCKLFVNDKIIKKIYDDCCEDFYVEIKNVGEYKVLNYVFSIQEIKEPVETFKKDDEFTEFITISDINFVLRPRKDGDIIKPLGLCGSQKLKKYLNGKKIPNHEKDKLILLCDLNEVLWVAGIGLSDKIKTVDKPTHVIKLRRNCND